MFLPVAEPPKLRAEHLYRMRISLNTPVVETEDLPEGPARAGLIVHFDPEAGLSVTVGIRSLTSGDVAFYSYSRELSGGEALESGIAAALRFAEPMGFLFDEDEIDEPAEPVQSRALGLWTELMAAPASDVTAELEPQRTFTFSDRAIELDALSDLEAPPKEEEDFDEIDLGAEGIELAPTTPRPALTKFRTTSARGRRSDDPQTKGQALGRVQLVKRRLKSEKSPRNPVLKLLGSF